MTDNYIQLKKDDSLLKFGIRDAEGNDTGNFLVFNVKDINLPMKCQKIIDEHYRNLKILKNQLAVINNKTDRTGKKALSLKEEETLKTVVAFLEKQKELYDSFLGEGGVDKLLNGKELSWDSFEEINEILEKFIF